LFGRKFLWTLFVLAACGPSAQPATPAVPATTTVATTTTADDGFPVEVAGVRIEARPARIISLSPTATEILFAIGAGPQVVAVDDASNYPESVPRTDLSGITPNLEAIAAMQPNLVVASFAPDDLAAGLEVIGVPLLIQGAAASLDDTYAQIEQLGVATGNLDAASQLVAEMADEILGVTAASPPPGERLLTYYHELDASYFTVASSTFIGEIYGLLGLRSIADPADADGFGYPQLSAEFILAQDPDFIFLADTKCCGQNAATVAQREGWDSLTAVQSGAILELDDDVASRWGPRVVDFLETVAAAVKTGVPG
jgi:iron complex transport system substrate-binding protein